MLVLALDVAAVPQMLTELLAVVAHKSPEPQVGAVVHILAY